jgi:hypothetical protein
MHEHHLLSHMQEKRKWRGNSGESLFTITANPSSTITAWLPVSSQAASPVPWVPLRVQRVVYAV